MITQIAKSCWSLLLWLFVAITTLISPETFTYGGQSQTRTTYDERGSPSVFRYDSAAVPFADENEGRTVGAKAFFADFAGLVAAKTTTSLARSPWPANSGFIERTVERKFLMPGEAVDRYGFGGGRFVSPAGTSVEARALRPRPENLRFNTYQVVKPIEVNAGGVQPWFGQPGLGTQCELPVSVNVLLKRGFIQPVTP